MLVDKDGDLWIYRVSDCRTPGWCSQTPCPDCERRHTCDEHDHFTIEQMAEWAPFDFSPMSRPEYPGADQLADP